MITQLNATPDQEIISMIDQNNSQGWKNLYDKYALTMYIAILWVIDDAESSKNILFQLFNQLKLNKSLLSTKRSVYESLIQYTYKTAYKMLASDSYAVQQERNKSKEFSMINGMVYNPFELVNEAKIQDKIKEKGIERLCSDLNHIYNKNLVKTKTNKIKKSDKMVFEPQFIF